MGGTSVRGWMFAVLFGLVSAAVAASPAPAAGPAAIRGEQAGAQQQAPQRVVLVGDSIMAGATRQLDSVFRSAGHDVVVDAAESRSTTAGAAVAADHVRSGGADAVVLMLGANDGASADSYRQGVREVVRATAFVPRIYWLTVPEVRSYYPAANQVVREELALRPGSAVLDWAAVGSSAGLASGDGLHLTNAGADALAWFVAVNVVPDLRADAAASAVSTTTGPPVAPGPTNPPTGDGQPSAGEGSPASIPTATTDESGAQGSEAAAPEGDSTGGGTGGIRSVVEDPGAAAETAADSSFWRIAAGTSVAAVGLLAVLGTLGASLALWALWRTRGRIPG